jgi:hypothetical protein
MAIGVIGMTAAPALAAPSPTTDFSSQQKKKKVAPSNASGVQQRKATVNRNVNVNRTVKTNRNLRNVGGPAAAQKVLSNPVVSAPKGGTAAKLQLGPGKVGPATAAPANFQFVKLGNKAAPAWKSGPKKIWWGGGWKTFVPLTALGVVVLGGAYYYPDAYLTLARPYCTGVTPDGCRLNWQRIDFEDGNGEWQCVQFCRRLGLPPPPRTVALIAPPAMAQGACELAIFSEPNFGGTNATAADEQPNLGENGWQNQIASVQVKSGTWDFFSDQQFTGETMRLAPGSYADLGPQWTKRAGSFMCVQP